MKILMLLYFALLCFCILKNERAAASKGKATIAAVPKGKKGRKSSGFSFGLMNRLIREAKVAFSSGLEALTLQMTRPDSNPLQSKDIGNLAASINQYYSESPDFVACMVSKFSRKYMEDNVFTKLKSLLSIHTVFNKLDEDAQRTLKKCINYLRRQKDPKFAKSFFASDLNSNIASNVAELEMFAILREYFTFIFLYIDTRGDESKASNDNIEKKIQSLLQLIEKSEAIEKLSSKAEHANESPICKQFVETVIHDGQWAIKQLSKLCESKIASEAVMSQETMASLSRAGYAFRGQSEVELVASDVTSDPYVSPSGKGMEAVSATPAVEKTRNFVLGEGSQDDDGGDKGSEQQAIELVKETVINTKGDQELTENRSKTSSIRAPSKAPPAVPSMKINAIAKKKTSNRNSRIDKPAATKKINGKKR